MDDQEIDPAIPAHWHAAFRTAGIFSASEIARRTGKTTTTVMRLLRGKTKSSLSTVEAVRGELRLSTPEMGRLMGRSIPPPVKFPAEFGLLTTRQQEAIVSVMKSMIDPAQEQPRLRRVARPKGNEPT